MAAGAAARSPEFAAIRGRAVDRDFAGRHALPVKTGRASIQSLADEDGRRGDPQATDDAILTRENERLQAMIDRGERTCMEQRLAQQHIAVSDAAARYVATLTPGQLAKRAALLATP